MSSTDELQTSEDGHDLLPIVELEPRMNDVYTRFKVVSLTDPKEIHSRRDDETHVLQEATVGDATGTVVIPLWDEAREKFEIGKTYVFENGYTGLFKGMLRLKLSDDTSVEADDEEIEYVNMSTNMSKDNRRRGFSYRDGSQGYKKYRGYTGSRRR